MKNQSFCEKERRRIEKLNKFQLPNSWKKIGWIIFGISIFLLFTRKLITDEIWLRFVLRNTIILGLLIVSLSKEKIEDEYIVKLRSQSYRLAFVFGVIYALIQPWINAIVNSIIKPNPLDFDAFKYFEVLIVMLLVQVMFFYQLKRMNS